MPPERLKAISPNLQPSDKQLEALIEAVATEARKHAETAHQQLMIRLRAEIATINPFPAQA